LPRPRKQLRTPLPTAAGQANSTLPSVDPHARTIRRGIGYSSFVLPIRQIAAVGIGDLLEELDHFVVVQNTRFDLDDHLLEHGTEYEIDLIYPRFRSLPQFEAPHQDVFVRVVFALARFDGEAKELGIQIALTLRRKPWKIFASKSEYLLASS
jgi:hypothetical protein